MRWVILAATAGALWIPDLPPGAQQKIPPSITSLVASPDNKSIVSGSQSGVKVSSLKANETQSIATKLEHILCLVFSPDGKTLAIGGGSAAEAGSVELWSWPDKKLLGTFEGHTDLVHDVAWLGDGNSLATASADRTLRIWNKVTRKCDATLTGHSGPVLCVVCLPDGKTICSGSADQTIRVWNSTDSKLIRSLDNHLGPVHALAVRPTKEKDAPVTLASASGDSTVRIWQPAIGRLVRIVRHPAPVFCLAWNPDGTLLASAGKNGTLRTVDGDSDKVLAKRQLTNGWIVSLARIGQTSDIIAGTTLGEIQTTAFPR